LYSNVENLTIIRSRNYDAEMKFTQEHNEKTFLIK